MSEQSPGSLRRPHPINLLLFGFEICHIKQLELDCEESLTYIVEWVLLCAICNAIWIKERTLWD